MGQAGHDPARPQGVTSDAQGLGTAADVAAGRTSAEAGAGGEPEAPEALGHRVADHAPGRSRSLPGKP